MRRGEIWTVAGGGDYTGNPRPVVILQDDRFEFMDSVTICPFTTDPADAPLFRVLVEPDEQNGLGDPSRLMVDKVTTVRKSRFGSSVGRLSDEDMVRMNQAVLVFLGFAGASRASSEI
jgi:mRNA interferase MazF